MTAWWRWYAVLGAFGCVAYFLVPTVVMAQSVFVLVGASAVAATVIGTRMHRPRNHTAWLTIAAGTALWVLGDIAFNTASTICPVFRPLLPQPLRPDADGGTGDRRGRS